MRFFLLLVPQLLLAAVVAGVGVDEFISGRLSELDSLRFTESQEYWPTEMYPPLRWNQQKGLYASYVHVNFHGSPLLSALRNGYKFPDNNGFVTMFVLQALVESAELNPTIEVPAQSMMDALSAVLEHQDKNEEFGTPVYTFWNQELNEQGNYFHTIPENIATPIGEGVQVLEKVTGVLESLNLTSALDKVQPLESFFKTFYTEFRIPADSDDTGCNLALGMKLKQLKNRFPVLYEKWSAANFKFEGLIDKLKIYHYEPFSDDDSLNTIDPRTYFWIRGLLNEHKAKYGKKSSLSLITTWLLSQADVQKNFVSKGVSMPFQANNVDASVAANMLFGLISASFNQEGFFRYTHEEKIRNLISGTADMLEWILRENVINNRPDLTLLYYPPVYDFYWFVARIVHLLNNPPSGKVDRFLANIRDQLTPAIEIYGTEQILGRIQRDGNHVFWDDFLGDADTNVFGAVSPQYEDRVFSTCAALNALIDIWTDSEYNESDSTKTLSWKCEAEDSLKEVISGGINWLIEKSSEFPSENVFFSGSMKSPVYSIPFWYPHNVLHSVRNNTDFDGCSSNVSFSAADPFLVGVRGVYTEKEYMSMLSGKCHNQSIPITYPGHNCDSCAFPYWSAPSLTKALQVLVLSKAKSLGIL
eukprot:TRINITY_DN15835_c0_g2_i1.p1 TRINITY_DN15835_c0_g2~~TRINITY_DN15835_c0_g2_i1.p1  ORF type:complete len:644 (+),score=160.84 TRINITY_DN15835_c0_g2_i1:90-2021(+)